MEFVILGLLQVKDMTEQEIVGFVSKALPFVYWENEGGVKAALKHLVRSAKIGTKEHVEKGERKIVYNISRGGADDFDAWIKTPMQPDKVRNMELSKLFFLGLARESDRKKAIEGYIQNLIEMREGMIALKNLFNELYTNKMAKPMPQKDSDVIEYQLHTLAYGVDSTQFEIEWYAKLLKSMK